MEFRAPPAIPKFIDTSTSQAIDELFPCDSSSSALARYGGTGFEMGGGGEIVKRVQGRIDHGLTTPTTCSGASAETASITPLEIS